MTSTPLVKRGLLERPEKGQVICAEGYLFELERRGYKPEHAVDLDTGVVVAAPIHAADEGDTKTLTPTLEAAARNVEEVGLAPSVDEPCVLVADKGYHSRAQLKALDGGSWKTRITVPPPITPASRGLN